jgi:AraC-like DNA-binding protein
LRRSAPGHCIVAWHNSTTAQQHTSYSQVVDQARLMKATKLMKERDVRLLDISLMLGYEDASTFTRAFRPWSGVSPREYRYLYSAA